MRKIPIFALFALFFLAGCSSGPEIPPLCSRVWHPAGGPDTAELYLNPYGRAGGFTGNNSFFAPAVIGEKGELTFGALMMTQSGGRHAEFERRYIKVLGSVRSYRCDGAQLIFYDAGGRELMRFRGGAPLRRKEK